METVIPSGSIHTKVLHIYINNKSYMKLCVDAIAINTVVFKIHNKSLTEISSYTCICTCVYIYIYTHIHTYIHCIYSALSLSQYICVKSATQR